MGLVQTLQDLWKRTEWHRLCLTVLLVIVDVGSDIANGIKLLHQGDSLGITCGVLTLCVVLLPGLIYGMDVLREEYQDQPFKMILKIVQCMFTYPIDLICKGIHCVHDPNNARKKFNFESLKCNESIVEGGLQLVITLHYITLTDSNVSYITIGAVTISFVSTCLGCIKFITLLKLPHVVTLHFPVRLLAVLSLPETLIVAVSAHPVIENITSLFEDAEDGELWVVGSLVVLYVVLGLWSLVRFYFIFISDESGFLFDNQMQRRVTMLESGEKLTKQFQDDLPYDVFWRVQTKMKKIIFLTLVMVSDLIIMAMSTTATVFVYQKAGNIGQKVILTICLIMHVLATLLNLFYFIVPSVFIEYNKMSIDIIELGELMYPTYVTLNKHEQLDFVRLNFRTLYFNMHHVCQVQAFDDIKTFPPIVEKLTQKLKQLQNSNTTDDVILFNKIEAFNKELRELLKNLLLDHWIPEEEAYEKGSIAYVKKIEHLLQRLFDDLEKIESEIETIMKLLIKLQKKHWNVGIKEPALEQLLGKLVNEPHIIDIEGGTTDINPESVDTQLNTNFNECNDMLDINRTEAEQDLSEDEQELGQTTEKTPLMSLQKNTKFRWVPGSHSQSVQVGLIKQDSSESHTRCEVLVVGSGVAGLSAALAAHHAGADVLLIIEKLGSIDSFTLKEFETFPRSRCEELLRGESIGTQLLDLAARLGVRKRKPEPVDEHTFSIASDPLLKDSGIRLLLDTCAIYSIMDRDTIKGIIVEENGRRKTIIAERVIDCTEEAKIIHYSGAEYETVKDEELMEIMTDIEFTLEDKVKLGGTNEKNDNISKERQDFVGEQEKIAKNNFAHAIFVNKENLGKIGKTVSLSNISIVRLDGTVKLSNMRKTVSTSNMGEISNIDIIEEASIVSNLRLMSYSNVRDAYNLNNIEEARIPRNSLEAVVHKNEVYNLNSEEEANNLNFIGKSVSFDKIEDTSKESNLGKETNHNLIDKANKLSSMEESVNIRNTVDVISKNNEGGKTFNNMEEAISLLNDGTIFSQHSLDDDTTNLNSIGEVTNLNNNIEETSILSAKEKETNLQNHRESCSFSHSEEILQQSSRSDIINLSNAEETMEPNNSVDNSNINNVQHTIIDVTDVEEFNMMEEDIRNQERGASKQLKDSMVPGFAKEKLRSCRTIKEVRKIVGMYNLTGEDMRNQARVEDSIGICYEIKYPHSGRCFQVPYGCLVPAGVKNLLVAGQCVAGDKQSYHSMTSLMASLVTGQGAGVAAAVSVKEGADTHNVNIDTIQKELKNLDVKINVMTS